MKLVPLFFCIILVLSVFHQSSVIVSQNNSIPIGISSTSVGDILILHGGSPVEANAVTLALTSVGYTVDQMDLLDGIPTLIEIQGYKLIILLINYVPSDEASVGNLMADYVDNGGRLIIYMFAFLQSLQILGRLGTQQLSPFINGTFPYVPATYNGNSTHPALSGVSYFTTDYAHGDLIVTPETVILANYSEGYPFVAQKRNILGINGLWPPVNSGDNDTLIVSTTNYMLRTSILLFHTINQNETLTIASPLVAAGYVVDFLNATSSIPMPPAIQNYDLIISVTNKSFSDPIAAGDVLADYIENEGRLILYAFGLNATEGISGRLITDQLTPYSNGTNPHSTGSYAGGSFHISISGVSSFTSDNADPGITVSTGSKIRVNYSEGYPFIVQKARILGVNAYPLSGFSGERDNLVLSTVQYMLRPSILLFHTYTQSDLDLISPILIAGGYAIDDVDVALTTPSLSLLSDYDLVIAHRIEQPANSIEAGNVLADFVQSGGRLIMYAYSMDAIGGFTGRLIDSQLSPVINGYGLMDAATYSGGSAHPALEGVSSYATNTAETDFIITPGTEVLASYSEGYPFIMQKRNILVLNTYPFSDFTGDRNALLISTANYMLNATIAPSMSPNLSIGSPSVNIDENSVGNIVSWTFQDDDPWYYEIWLDDSFVWFDYWQSGVSISYAIDNLVFGDHNATIIVYDTSELFTAFQTTIHVQDNTSPVFLTIPQDLSYIEGSVGNVVNWSISDVRPANYQIEVDEVVSITGTWTNGSEISFVVDGLAVGIHNITLSAWDTLGNSAVDTVIITVTESSNTNISSTPPNMDTSTPPTSPSSPNPSDSKNSVAPSLLVIFTFLMSIIWMRKQRKHI